MNVTSAAASRGSKTALTIQGEAVTARLASQLAVQCRAGDCLLLSGEVGAGKTSFARAFIQTLCPGEQEIVSPTFTLVQTYPLKGGGQLWHFDLYRLRHEDELLETGLEEALEMGITLIEWPDMARPVLPASALDIQIEHGTTEEERRFIFNAPGAIWEQRLQLLKGMT